MCALSFILKYLYWNACFILFVFSCCVPLPAADIDAAALQHPLYGMLRCGMVHERFFATDLMWARQTLLGDEVCAAALTAVVKRGLRKRERERASRLHSHVSAMHAPCVLHLFVACCSLRCRSG